MPKRVLGVLGRGLYSSTKCRRRVVVTGIGVVSPLGVGTKYAWQALLEGKCGVVKLDSSEYDKLPCKIGSYNFLL